MKKLIRVTTADISLDGLIKGQLRFLSQYYEVIGVSSDTGLLQSVAEREGIRTIEVPMHREISIKADINCLGRLVKLFRREKPFIVHANTPKGSLLALIAAKIAGVPNRLYTVTGLRYQGATGIFRFILMSMERISCLFATRVIPEGMGVKKALVADHITSKPLEVILNGNINGIDTSYFEPDACRINRKSMRDSLNLSDDDFVFIFIGRIVRDKGMNELADAMRRLKGNYSQCKLILVGPFESELDPLDADNETFYKTDDCVRYVGFQEDVRPYLLAADALVFPSYREGFPNVVMQAGAMGLPSIVTDINGCNEIIIDGENGRIIPPRNIDALYNMMKRFMDDTDDVAYMAAKARDMIKDRYEQRDVWNALLDTYRQLEN